MFTWIQKNRNKVNEMPIVFCMQIHNYGTRVEWYISSTQLFHDEDKK